MYTDYRKLCMELFGTDDVAELRKIAENLQMKNPRGAGRKKRFADSDVQNMKRLSAAGMDIQDIAMQYGTTRQTVSRYLHSEPDPKPGYTMRLTYMFRRTPCTIIDVDFLNQRIAIQNQTDDLLHRAFGILENPTWEDFEIFLKDRCFPATRGNAKELLASLNLTDHDPLQIVEKTQGRMAEDELWLKTAYFPLGEIAYGKN